MLTYSWESFAEDIDFLAHCISKSGFAPDWVIGLARGGVVPGVYLSHALNAKFISIPWGRNSRDSKDITTAIEYMSKFGRPSNILIVDDICDDGHTLKTFTHTFRVPQSTGADINIKVATLWYNHAQNIFSPEYFSCLINRDIDTRWINFPWEAQQL